MTSPFSTNLAAAEPHGPYLRRGWTANRIAVVYLLALFPPLVAAFAGIGLAYVPVLAAAVITVLFWQVVFGAIRRRTIWLDGLVTATTFALLVGTSVPLWQAVLAISAGVILAEQAFGGRGFNFLNPVVVALVFLVFSFPATVLEPAGLWLSAAAVPGAALLLWLRLVSWRLLAGLLAVMLIWSTVAGGVLAFSGIYIGHGLFILIFLACDPVGSAATNAGRWANGLLVGGLICLFAAEAGLDAGPVPYVAAILLGSIFAPLIDAVVVKINVRAREKRRG